MKLKTKLILFIAVFLVVSLSATIGLRYYERMEIEKTAEATVKQLNSISKENVYDRLKRLGGNVSDLIVALGIEKEAGLEPGEKALKKFLNNNSEIKTIYLLDNNAVVLSELLKSGQMAIWKKGEKVGDSLASQALTNQSAFIDFKENMADVYYPVVSEGKLKFLLYIAIDTSPYFQSSHIAEESLKNILSKHMDSSRSVTIGSLILSLSLLVIMWLLLQRGFRIMNRLVENSKKVASGDLTVKELGTKSRDEIGSLALSYNEMIRSMNELVSHISLNASDVTVASEQLKKTIEQTITATESVAGSMQEIAAGSADQLESIEAANRAMRIINENVRSILQSVACSRNQSALAHEKASEGNGIILSAIKQMDTIDARVDRLSEAVINLGDRTREIEQIIGVISNITEQTNLLSLNASIEAARAGEHGKGFAVVANEVRKLAIDSNTSTKQIADIIAKIQTDSGEVVKEMNTVREEVTRGKTLSSSAGTLFDTIYKAINSQTESIEDISGRIAKASGNIDHLVSITCKISEISTNNTHETQNISAASEEQLASMEEIDMAVGKLREMAETLRQSVSRFRIE